MAKDPAFLFYPNDWIGGTMGMTFEEKGAYMELLVLQFNRGHMTSHMIGQVVGQLWVNIKDKFVQDEKGLWYNTRLDAEKEKRETFVNSRRNNIKGHNQYTPKRGHMRGHTTSHMEIENENVNEDEKRKGGVGEKQEVIFPFDSENFLTLWGHWKQYKAKEWGFKFKSPQSEQAALAKLANMSSGDEATAMAIITQSIENGWKGFFELKQNTNNVKRTSLESRLERANELIDQMYGQ